MFAPLFARIVKSEPLELWLDSKIEEQTNLNVSGAKIIE
jgi:hypothetical protein